MTTWGLVLGLAGMLVGVQLDLDCARPAAARELIGRARLSEIEWAEDVNRAAMWDAFGRCPAGPRAEACREEQRARFGAEMDGEKAAIEAKYHLMLKEFEDRCRASIVRLRAAEHAQLGMLGGRTRTAQSGRGAPKRAVALRGSR